MLTLDGDLINSLTDSRGCGSSALPSTFAEGTKTLVDAEQWLQRMEEQTHATCEASFETKGWNESRTGVGCRRVVSIAGGGRIRNDRWAGSRYAGNAEYRARARNYPWRGGNLRRQPGDVLCFRQGKLKRPPGRHTGRLERLWRLPRLRRLPGLWLPRLQMRLWLRVRRLRLRLLPVVGSLPFVLGESTSQVPADQAEMTGRGGPTPSTRAAVCSVAHADAWAALRPLIVPRELN